MKRITSLMLIMVMLLSILVGCANNNVSDISSELTEVSSGNTEQVDNNSEITKVENSTTESNVIEENSEVSNDGTPSKVTSNTSQTTKPNKKPSTGTSNNKPNSGTNNTTSSITPSTSDSSTGNASSSSTNNSTVEDNYVYRDPTIYVDGMYTLETAKNKPAGKILRMGELYIDRNYVSEKLTYINPSIGGYCTFDDSHIVTDLSKMPSNYQIYPFVVDTIPNWLYEINLPTQMPNSPLAMYTLASNKFISYAESVSCFYYAIGNIDYNTVVAGYINGKLKGSLYDDYKDPIDMADLSEYVEYVKKNKIKLSTVAEPLLPIVYSSDGYGFFLRTKVTVNVESSDIDTVKMYFHDNLKLNKGKTVFYIDVPFTWHFWSDPGAGINVDKKDISKYIIA